MRIAQRILSTGGRATGFDYLRLVLALAIVVWHSVATSYGLAVAHALYAGPLRAVLGALLPMFFALSGFLVAGSLQRCRTLPMFLALRALRIFPALTVEVVLSALVLGPLLTTLPLAQYLTDPLFWQYLRNAGGDVHFFLPGVFAGNPVRGQINAQLWTVPFELKCYLVLALLATLGGLRQRRVIPLALLALTLLEGGRTLWLAQGKLFVRHGYLPGWVLVASFLAGVLLYLYRDRVAYSAGLALLAALACGLLLLTGAGDVLVALPAAYLTVFLGLRNPRKLALLRGADYSYGIFLYGGAIQQTFAALGDWTHHAWLNTLVCVPLAALFAALSWHGVEQPALALKRFLPALERRWLALCARGRMPAWLGLPGRPEVQ